MNTNNTKKQFGGQILTKYDTIFVIDSLLKSEEIESIINKYERFISANGGQIERIDQWGKKRLAYEIKKRQYGYYVAIRFDGPPTMIKQLEREYRLNESLLRYKTFKLDKLAIKILERNVEEEMARQAVEASAEKSTPAESTESEESTDPETANTEIENPEAEKPDKDESGD
jgi:small subunit ribosomal protein S6